MINIGSLNIDGDPPPAQHKGENTGIRLVDREVKCGYHRMKITWITTFSIL